MQDKVKSFNVPNAELEFSAVSNIYGGRILKVEGTFYEYTDDVILYTATETEEAYSITGLVAPVEIEVGDIIQLYELNGDFDGVMDIIILIKK